MPLYYVTDAVHTMVSPDHKKHVMGYHRMGKAFNSIVDARKFAYKQNLAEHWYHIIKVVDAKDHTKDSFVGTVRRFPYMNGKYGIIYDTEPEDSRELGYRYVLYKDGTLGGRF